MNYWEPQEWRGNCAVYVIGGAPFQSSEVPARVLHDALFRKMYLLRLWQLAHLQAEQVLTLEGWT